MKKVALISLCLSVLLTSLYVYDRMQYPKTAFVNIQEVFSKFELKKDYEKKLNFSKISRQKIVDSLEMELKILGRKIESENAKNKEDLSVFSVKRESYMEKRKLLEEDNMKQTKQYDNEIILQMNQYIKDYGKENDYTYIFGSDGNGSLMYAKDSKDVTKGVIDYINAHYRGMK